MANSAHSRRMWYGVVAATLLVGVSVALWYHWKGSASDGPAPALSGTSDAFPMTALVPTLDTPIPKGKSAIWCSSFQLAWNRLKDEVAKGPVQLTNAQTVADRLNNAEQTDGDLNSEDVYAAAGLAKDGIVERIQTEMLKKFPSVPKPELDVPADGAVAYGYLKAAVRFTMPFFDNEQPFFFTDSAGKATAVRSFGVRELDMGGYLKLRAQVEVLHCRKEAMGRDIDLGDFVLDPCKTSSPYQIVLARVKPQETLAATFADVQRKIKEPTKVKFDSRAPADAVLIPNMSWRFAHRFKELEGRDKVLQNPGLQGLYLDIAYQMITLRLDKSGADLASEAKLGFKGGGNKFYFDRPFLMYMKKRDGKQPFFVMWVDNAELLLKN